MRYLITESKIKQIILDYLNDNVYPVMIGDLICISSIGMRLKNITVTHSPLMMRRRMRSMGYTTIIEMSWKSPNGYLIS